MKTFLTEYMGSDGLLYRGKVEALDWEHAESLALEGHTVIGELFLTISGPGMTNEKADKICRNMADSIWIEDDCGQESDR